MMVGGDYVYSQAHGNLVVVRVNGGGDEQSTA